MSNFDKLIDDIKADVIKPKVVKINEGKIGSRKITTEEEALNYLKDAGLDVEKTPKGYKHTSYNRAARKQIEYYSGKVIIKWANDIEEGIKDHKEHVIRQDGPGAQAVEIAKDKEGYFISILGKDFPAPFSRSYFHTYKDKVEAEEAAQEIAQELNVQIRHIDFKDRKYNPKLDEKTKSEKETLRNAIMSIVGSVNDVKDIDPIEYAKAEGMLHKLLSLSKHKKENKIGNNALKIKEDVNDYLNEDNLFRFETSGGIEKTLADDLPVLDKWVANSNNMGSDYGKQFELSTIGLFMYNDGELFLKTRVNEHLIGSVKDGKFYPLVSDGKYYPASSKLAQKIADFLDQRYNNPSKEVK